MKTTATRPWPVRGIAAAPAAMTAMLAATLISAGCDSGSFVPAPPESQAPDQPGYAATYDSATVAPTAAGPATGKPRKKDAGHGGRVVELILARPGDGDRLYFDQVLRRELAKARIPLRLTQPGSLERSSPEDLAGAIRAAVGRGAVGLVVEPRDEARVVDALYEAVDRGVAVLLLDRTVPARGGKTISHVEYTAFADVGRRIVQSVLEADRSPAGARPGRIIFLHHRTDDLYLERSFAALLGPCKAAGRPTEMIEWDGDADHGIAALKKSMEADPKVDIVLADDATGMFVGFRVHLDLMQSGQPGFRLAGFTPYDYRIVTFLPHFYAMGDRSVEAYALKASQAIRSLMDGKAVGAVVEVPVRFNLRETEPTPTAKKTPALPAGRKP